MTFDEICAAVAKLSDRDLENIQFAADIELQARDENWRYERMCEDYLAREGGPALGLERIYRDAEEVGS